MTAITRVNDQGIGTHIPPNHGSVSVQFTTGADTVFVNNLAGGKVIGTTGIASCGDSTIAMTGSPTVFFENMPVHRIGDTGEVIAGGEYTVTTGSSDVFADS